MNCASSRSVNRRRDALGPCAEPTPGAACWRVPRRRRALRHCRQMVGLIRTLRLPRYWRPVTRPGVRALRRTFRSGDGPRSPTPRAFCEAHPSNIHESARRYVGEKHVVPDAIAAALWVPDSSIERLRTMVLVACTTARPPPDQEGLSIASEPTPPSSRATVSLRPPVPRRAAREKEPSRKTSTPPPAQRHARRCSEWSARLAPPSIVQVGSRSVAVPPLTTFAGTRNRICVQSRCYGEGQGRGFARPRSFAVEHKSNNRRSRPGAPMKSGVACARASASTPAASAPRITGVSWIAASFGSLGGGRRRRELRMLGLPASFARPGRACDHGVALVLTIRIADSLSLPSVPSRRSIRPPFAAPPSRQLISMSAAASESSRARETLS